MAHKIINSFIGYKTVGKPIWKRNELAYKKANYLYSSLKCIIKINDTDARLASIAVFLNDREVRPANRRAETHPQATNVPWSSQSLWERQAHRLLNSYRSRYIQLLPLRLIATTWCSSTIIRSIVFSPRGPNVSLSVPKWQTWKGHHETSHSYPQSRTRTCYCSIYLRISYSQLCANKRKFESNTLNLGENTYWHTTNRKTKDSFVFGLIAFLRYYVWGARVFLMSQ